MRVRFLLSALATLMVAGLLAVGFALPAQAATPALVHDQVGLLTRAEASQLNQVLDSADRKYGVHLSVTLLKKLPADMSLKSTAKAAAMGQGLSAQAQRTQVVFLYVRHAAQAYTVLGSAAAKKITESQADTIWRNQIHARFHMQEYYQGLRKGVTLMASSYVGLSDGAFTQPVPSAAQVAMQNANGWSGMRLSLYLVAAVAVVSLVLHLLFWRRRRNRMAAL